MAELVYISQLSTAELVTMSIQTDAITHRKTVTDIVTPMAVLVLAWIVLTVMDILMLSTGMDTVTGMLMMSTIMDTVTGTLMLGMQNGSVLVVIVMGMLMMDTFMVTVTGILTMAMKVILILMGPDAAFRWFPSP
eukprot:TRINITY_DN77451_c0_g1_i1.p3 TRINITY_DN77451_c0_g1~~TRINITY_DN77451_c0_g1_i1.p3  ORF type:complete len:135 (-),score=29.14 TRINITY_DN77451_c0_g1_i1:243-647(-)